MKITIFLIGILSTAQGLPTFKEMYAGARSAFGMSTVEDGIIVTPEQIDVSLPAANEEVTTSKYSIRAVVNKAKTYIPSASSLVPRFAYKDGVVSYSWGIFHMSGGIYRPTPSPDQISKITPNLTTRTKLSPENPDDETEITSNVIPRSTTEEVVESEDYVEKVDTSSLRSIEHSEEIDWKPTSQYDIDFPTLPPVEDEIESRDIDNSEAQARSESNQKRRNDSILESVVRNRHVKNEDVDFWRAEHYLGKKFGKPFFNYLIERDLI